MPLEKRPNYTQNQALSTGIGALGGPNVPANRSVLSQGISTLTGPMPIPPTPSLEETTAGLLYQQNQQLVGGVQSQYNAFDPYATGPFRTSNTENPNVFDPSTSPPPPEGSLGYDKYGNPYFGPGFEGWWKKFLWSVNGQQQTKDDQLSFGDRFEGVWDAAWGSLFDVLGEPAIKTAQTASLVEEYERMGEETIKSPWLQGIIEMVGNRVPGGMSVLPMSNIYNVDYRERDVEFVNKIGDKLGFYNLGRVAEWGHNVLDSIEKVRTGLFDFFSPNSIYMALAPMNQDFVKNFTGVKKGNILEGELPGLNPDARLNAAWNAGRLLYTSILDPMARYEYMREYMNGDGQDKFNLYQEYENPWVEMAGQMIFDPLNFIPFSLIRNADQMAGARRMFSVLPPGLEDIFKSSIDNIPLQERAWQDMDNVLKQKLVDNVKLAHGAADVELDNWAKAKGLFGPNLEGNTRRAGILPTFNLTTTAKRTVVGKTIGELTNAIVTATGKDPDKFADVIRGLYLMGSNNEAEIAEGLAIVMDFASPRMLMSRGGQYLTTVLRNMVDEDIDGFVKTGQRIFQEKGLEDYLKFIDNKYNAALEKMIPSSDTKVAAQLIIKKLDNGKLNPGDEFVHAGIKYTLDDDTIARMEDIADLGHINTAERAALAVHDATRPFYAAVNNFFSTVYMGMSPRYAIRNMINNYFTAGVDNGVGSVFGNRDSAIAGLEKILGWVPEGASRGISGGGPIASSGGKSYKWMQWGQKWAEKFEGDAAAKITYVAVDRAMRQMVQPGKALPDFAPLIQAGFDPGLVNRLTNMVINNGYDVKPVVKEILEAMSSGKRVRGALEWMPGHLIKPLKEIGLYDDMVEATKGATTKEQAIEAIEKIWKNFVKYGDQADEAAPAVKIADEVANDGDWLNIAQEFDRVFGEASSMSKNAKGFRDANVAAEWEIRAVLGAIYQRTGAGGVVRPEFAEVRKTLEKVLMNVEKSPYTRLHDIIRQRVLDLKTQLPKMSDADAKKAYEALFTTPFPDDLQNLPRINEVIQGLKAMLPGIGAEWMERKGTLGKAWEHFFFPRMRFVWDKYVDELYMTLMDENVGIIKQVNAIDPGLIQDMGVKLPQIDDAYRTAKQWGAWSEAEQWAQLFSAATPEGRLSMLAAEYGIPTAKETGEGANYMVKRVLRVVNNYMPDQYKARFPNGFKTVKEATENPAIVNEALANWKRRQPIDIDNSWTSMTGHEMQKIRSDWRKTNMEMRALEAEKFQIETYFMGDPKKVKLLESINKRLEEATAHMASLQEQIRAVEGPWMTSDGVRTSRVYTPGQQIVIPGGASYQPGRFASPSLGVDDAQVRMGTIRFLPPRVRDDIIAVGAEMRDEASRMRKFGTENPFGGFKVSTTGEAAAEENAAEAVARAQRSGAVPNTGDDVTEQAVRDGAWREERPASAQEYWGEQYDEITRYADWFKNLPAGHYIDRAGNKITNKMDAMNQIIKDLEEIGSLRKETSFTRAVMDEIWARARERTPNLGVDYADTANVYTVMNHIEDALNEIDHFRFSDRLDSLIKSGATDESRAVKALRRRIDELETRLPMRDNPEVVGGVDAPLFEEVQRVMPINMYEGWAGKVDVDSLEATATAAYRSLGDLIDNLSARGIEIPQEVQARLASLETRAKNLAQRYGRRGAVNVVNEAVPEVYLLDPIYTKGPFEYTLKFEDDIDTGLWWLSNPKVKGQQRKELIEYLKDMTGAGDDELAKMADNFKDRVTQYMKRTYPVRPKSVYNKGIPPSGPQIARESQKTVKAMIDRVIRGVDLNFGSEDFIVDNKQMRDALEKWAAVADQNITQSKLIAAQVGDIARDFALHDYRQKNSMDLILGYMYPYSYWYTRTYNNWMKRLAYNPAIMAGYAKYKDAMAKVHAGMPEWWKYNINVSEVLGIETDSPLYFNLESTLWPLYALTGVNFDDPKKRYNMVTTVMDTIDNFGPSPWTMYGIAAAMHASSKGETEAAQRLAGRLIPQTKDLRNMFALMGLGNVDIDPFIRLFSNGVDPYDQRLAVRALAWMQEEGKYTPEQIIEAGRTHEGPIWDEAVDRAVLYRAGGGRTGVKGAGLFLMSQLGVGFRPRTQEDMMIDMYDKDISNLYDMKDNLSPMEYGNSQDAIRAKYQFADIMTIARGKADQRDEYYSYNVLSRIPPGQRDDVIKLFGLDYDMIQNFYDSKGDILHREWIDGQGKTHQPWSESDRYRFMSAVLDIGTVLRLPDDATRQSWRAATTGYANMRDAMMKTFGNDIHMKIGAYYDFKDAGRGDEFLQLYPEVGDAFDFRTTWMSSDEQMAPYYSSIQALEIYYNNLRKEAVEKDAVTKFGITPDMAWQGYDEAVLNGDANDYWKKNPIMDWLMDQSDKYDKLLAERLVEVESKMKLPEFPGIRGDIPQGISGGAQALAQYATTGRPSYYDLPIEAFTSQMSPTLQSLVADYLYSGMALPGAADKQLDYIAQSMGIYNTQLMLEIMKSKAQ